MQSNDTSARPGIGPVQQPPLERELPMLAGIGAFVTWCEDLLAVLSGPILTAGLAIALVDLLSDGQLFTSLPILLWVWAGSMALGLDAQFIGSSAKLARAMRQRRGWVVFGYTILCISLGYVAFLATYVFAVQEANGLTTSAALARLGMDGTTWIFQRSMLAVVLVFLSGLLRYVPPAKDDALAALSEEERLQREIRLAPLRAQLRAQQARGARGMVAALTGREGQQPASQRVAAAASTLPPTAPPVQHQVPTYTAMHGDAEEYDPYGIPDESESDDTSYSTRSLPEYREPSDSLPKGVREYSDTASRESYPYDEMADDDEADTSYPNSRHARKKGKTATGRMNQRQRTQQLARQAQERQADNARDHIIDKAVAVVAAGISETGEQLSGYQLEDRVNEELERMGSAVRTTRKTVVKKLRTWLAERGAKSAMDDMEPQDLRELVTAESW